jgi:hypothetical protein
MRFSLIWDSGASVSLSHDKNDFVGELRKPSRIMQLRGIVKGICIEGIGYAAFSMTDSTGKLRSVKMKAVYCRQSLVKLLSITDVNMAAIGLTLSGCKTGDSPMNSIYSTINVKRNIPVSQAFTRSQLEEIPQSLIAIVSVVDRENQNLGAAGNE